MTVPGLYYVGLYRQRIVASTTLRGAGADAKVVVTHLWRYLGSQRQLSAQPATQGVVPQTQKWVSRSNELVSLIGLMTLALKQQTATQTVPSPRLVGEAVRRSLIVGAGFLGIGHAAALYSQKSFT